MDHEIEITVPCGRTFTKKRRDGTPLFFLDFGFGRGRSNQMQNGVSARFRKVLRVTLPLRGTEVALPRARDA